MSFIETIKEKARENLKTIVLPESTDIRVIEAARKVTDEGFAKVVLIGNRSEIESYANGIELSDISIVNPQEFERISDYENTLYELRKEKGMTPEKAHETLQNHIYFATMMVKMGDASRKKPCHSVKSPLRAATAVADEG